MAPVGEFVCDPRLVDFEENLEALIVIAQSERRNFLAYLLFMALNAGARGGSRAHDASPLRNGYFLG